MLFSRRGICFIAFLTYYSESFQKKIISLPFFLKKCISGCFFCISFIYSEVRQPLSQVRLSLAASLGTGQIIFLAGINAKGDEVSTSF